MAVGVLVGPPAIAGVRVSVAAQVTVGIGEWVTVVVCGGVSRGLDVGVTFALRVEVGTTVVVGIDTGATVQLALANPRATNKPRVTAVVFTDLTPLLF